METFYIFGFGVISALVVVGVIYSVLVMSRLKKQMNELDETYEELQEEIGNNMRYGDDQFQSMNIDIEKKFTTLYMDLDVIRSTIDSRFDKFDSKQRETYQIQLDSIYRDIDEMKRNSLALRESL
jgi:hypothetical protein